MTTITAAEGTNPDFFTEDEIVVAEILSNFRCAFNRPAALRWLHKRNRSGKRKARVKFKTPSPTTPLSFAPSNSDTIDAIAISNPIRRQGTKKKSNKEKKELMNELLTEQEKLKYQIVEMRKFDDRLLAMNLRLRSYESQLDQCKNSEETSQAAIAA